MQIIANNIRIEVEDTGSRTDPQQPVVLLIIGLGMQLIAWPPGLVRSLTEQGYRVIAMDNRDVGLSQHLDHLGTPNLMWAMLRYKLGLKPRPPYRLHDMAADALGVLDALGIAQAHVVGASMGGMIAQRVAIAAPERVRSLTSIMSTSGAAGLPAPAPHVMRALFAKPAGKDQAAIIDHYVKLFRIIGSPAYPLADAEIRQRIGYSVQRSHHPAGTLRQMMAIAADTQRAQELSQIKAPTLVIHGHADPLVPYACGVDTAQRIAGAQLLGIEGMGHDFPPPVVEQLLAPLLAHLQMHA